MACDVRRPAHRRCSEIGRGGPENMNTSRVGRLGLTDAEKDAIVSFMQTLTDGFMPVNHQ